MAGKSVLTCLDCGGGIRTGATSDSLGIAVAPNVVAFLCCGCATTYPSRDRAYDSLRRRLSNPRAMTPRTGRA